MNARTMQTTLTIPRASARTRDLAQTNHGTSARAKWGAENHGIDARAGHSNCALATEPTLTRAIEPTSNQSRDARVDIS